MSFASRHSRHRGARTWVNSAISSPSHHPTSKGQVPSLAARTVVLSSSFQRKAFDCVDHSKLWKILKEMGIPDNVICFLRNLYAGQEATVRTGHGTMEWFQIGKRICQSCILSPCLFNLESTSWEMPGWLKHKLTSRLPGFEISVTSDMERTPPYGREWRRTKEFFIKVKEESEIAGIKLNIQTTKIIASGHIIHGKQMGKEWKQWQILFSWVPKSL